MKIGFAMFKYPVDTVGGGVYATIVARKLADMGEDVHVFCAPSRERNLNSSEDELLHIHTIPVSSDVLFNFSYWSLLRHKISSVLGRVGPLDVLHSMGTAGFALPRRSKLWELNVCTMHHLSKCTIEELRPSIGRRLKGLGSEIGLMHFFERRCIDWADVVHAVSEYTKKSIVRLYNKPPDSVDIIPNAVPPSMLELSRTPSNDSEKRLTSKGTYNVLYVGRVYYRKRIEFLLRAFARIREEENAKLWIVGPGNIRNYQRLARELGIGRSVAFTGVVDRETLGRFYRECDVFAFPSACEGFGLVLLEAMINGLPAVACRNTAIPEVVGNSGVLVDPHDINLFADELLSLLRDGGRRLLIAEAARERVARKYLSWDTVTERILDSYLKHMN